MLNEIWPYSHALSRRWASPCRRSPSAVACGLDLHLLLQAVAASSRTQVVRVGIASTWTRAHTDGEANSHRYVLDDERNGSRCV